MAGHYSPGIPEALNRAGILGGILAFEFLDSRSDQDLPPADAIDVRPQSVGPRITSTS